MRSILVLFLLFFQSQTVFGKTSLLHCLGKEEKGYHKRHAGGPFPKINEKLISEFIQLSDTLVLKPKYQSEVCSFDKFPPSIQLLKLILVKKDKIFVSIAKKGDIVQRSLDGQTTEELITMGSFLFIELINDLQTQSKKPNCITKQIPALKDFYKKSRYILEDKGILELIAEIKNIESVFTKLLDPNLLKNCN